MYDDAGEILFDFIDEVEEADLDGGLGPGGTWQSDIVFEEADLNDISRYTIDIESAVN